MLTVGAVVVLSRHLAYILIRYGHLASFEFKKLVHLLIVDSYATSAGFKNLEIVGGVKIAGIMMYAGNATVNARQPVRTINYTTVKLSSELNLQIIRATQILGAIFARESLFQVLVGGA